MVARFPCPPLSPGVCSNLCSLSWWYNPTISSSATLFFFCLQIFPESRYFPMSHLFASSGQSIGASASASVLPMSIQVWFPLGLTSLISLLSEGLLRVFFSSTVQKHQLFGVQPSLWSNSHILSHYWKDHSLRLYRPLLAKRCLCFLRHCLVLSYLSFPGASIFRWAYY